MSMPAGVWSGIVDEAMSKLDRGWMAVGSGSDRMIVRYPDSWSLQFVYREETRSIGRLVAYSAFLGKHCPATVTGDSGFAVGGSTRLPEFHQCDDPDVVAKFAKYADASLFLQECDAPRQLDRLEAAFVRWSERGMADTMFWGQSFQELTMRRVLSASRGSNELSEDIVRILDEADFSVLSMLAGKAPDPATFYSDVLVALRAGDRPTVVGLLLENRRQTLVALGVPDSEVPSIDVPEAKVQW